MSELDPKGREVASDRRQEVPKFYYLASFRLCVLETVRQIERCCDNAALGVSRKRIVNHLSQQDYLSGDIESQVVTALNYLTANGTLRITEKEDYQIVYRNLHSWKNDIVLKEPTQKVPIKDLTDNLSETTANVSNKSDSLNNESVLTQIVGSRKRNNAKRLEAPPFKRSSK